MRRVLIFAYYFPPHGGGGVQRSVRFCRHLPELGYEPTVVTGPGVNSDGWAPPDRTLNDRVPAGTTVIRAPGPVPAPSSGWRNRAERALRLLDPFDRWWLEGATAAAREAVPAADVLYASMSPFWTAEAAARIAAESGKPWVADLRDPWALDEFRVYTSGLHRRLELGRMRSVLGSADAVVMNTSEAARALVRRFPELGEKPVVTVPNGFDALDFAQPARQRADHIFRIVHAGHVHTDVDSRPARLVRQLLSGETRGLDVSTRSHLFLLRAVARLLEVRPELRSRLEVHLAGMLSDSDRAGLPPEVVRAHGYLPHRETIGLLRSADLLFLPMHDLPRGVRSRLVPGKTYEYLAAGPPILAAVPDGDARDLLAEAGNAFLCRPRDVEQMASVVADQADRALRGESAPVARSEVVQRFEGRRLTADLAALLDRVLGVTARPELPVPVEVVA